MEAAGAYLRELREARNLSRVEVAERAGTNDIQVMRIEKGKIDTRGSLLLAIVNAVRGSAEHVMQLVLDPEATTEDGRLFAQSLLQGRVLLDDWAVSERDQVARILAIDDDIDVIAEIRRMRADLEQLERRVQQETDPGRAS